LVDATLTVAEAITILQPPIGHDRLVLILRALGIPPAEARHTGRPGKPPPAYRAADIMNIHAALMPWLDA
jgi:hypothetical protein